jgi:transcriptional regulator with XRE-family HTH domain
MGDLGSNLRDARKKLDLSQEQVAERSGVHTTEVSRIESGKRDPRVSTLKRLAAAVEVPPGRLLEYGQTGDTTTAALTGPQKPSHISVATE